MSNRKYAVGVDFGSESGRAVLVDVATGEELAAAVHPYSHGVIDETLPGTDIRLEPDWALQDPNDYLEVFKQAVPAVLRDSGVDPANVIGLGVDFTACTMLPTTADGTPLCFLAEWRNNPHAWVKLWKHHAAQDETNKLNETARELGYTFLRRYGGKISSEWFFPKAWQILDEAPEVYAAADRLIEAADWVVWQLTGVETRNECTAGYKAIWSKREGFPPDAFFKALDPRLEHIVDEKMSRTLLPLGAKAGELTAQAAEWTGLRPGTAVAVANVDAHVTVPVTGSIEPGTMVMIMGTSTCHVMVGEQQQELPDVPGMCGVVEGGVVPDLPGYEAGQSAVGDIFAWFVENSVPPPYHEEAQRRNLSLHALLEAEASRLEPGESGLLALDWWNGNRSTLVDVELSGLLIGMTLATKAPAIYRALIEATAFGTREIIETLHNSGVPVRRLVAAGGLPERNRLLMQIYADVTQHEIGIVRSAQAPAVGAAMHGAVAAGVADGGHPDIATAARHMGGLRAETYRPNPQHVDVYNRLYEEYRTLYDYFGRGANDVMKRLRDLRREIRTAQGKTEEEPQESAALPDAIEQSALDQ
ncbi:MAG TPA: ribulokinase [Herpetosiphonaceae bacterium]|nr:ribulokinase [Herpetosiphonaceae bacterium]